MGRPGGCRGRGVISALDMRDPDGAIDLLARAAAALRHSPLRRGSCVRLPARGRLLATGDLHDNPVHLGIILRLARLEHDADHHVVLHELIHGEHLINGVDLSHRMLLRVADLVLGRPGQVHPVLANHELSQMTGKGVSKGAGNSVDLFNAGLEYVFDSRWEDVAQAIGGFIRALPLAVRSDSGVLCAHSIPAARMLDRFDVGILDRELTDADYATNTGSAYLMTWGRGQIPEQVTTLAKAWNVRLFLLGHEHVETGCEMRGGQVIRLNSDHEQAAVVSIDLADPPTAEEVTMSAVRLRALG